MNAKEAFRVVEMVAAGKDPYTERGLSRNLPENNPDTVRALCVALSALTKELQVRDAKDLPESFSEVLAGDMPLDDAVATYEKETLLRALEATRHNKTKAAEILGVSYGALRYKLRQHGIE